MVVKALITGATKYKPKPFKPILKTKEEAKSLLQEAQKKIEKVKSGELKIERPTKIVPNATDEILKDGQGITTPSVISKKDFKVTPPKANIKKATEFLDEEKRIIESAEALKPEVIDGINIKTIQSTDDVLRSIEIIARQDKSKIVERTGGVVSRKETDELSIIINENKAQKIPAKTTVVNFGVSGRQRIVTVYNAKPKADRNPTSAPMAEPLIESLMIIIITPIKAKTIVIKVILLNVSFKIKYPTIAAINGIEANINNVTAADVKVIEKINPVNAEAKHKPPIIPEIPIFLKLP